MTKKSEFSDFDKTVYFFLGGRDREMIQVQESERRWLICYISSINLADEHCDLS